MSMLMLAEGSVFNHRYRVVRCIAMGGMGAVYQVVHLETERHRALKVMLPHLLHSEDLRSRFRQEARVAAHIESDFIVDVFDAGIDEATQMPFLVMELLRGEELGKLLQHRGRFSPAEAVTYLYQASLALDRTHRAHIVHRDLKPENLFLTQREDGAPRIKVLDFGIAKLVADGATHANATRSLGTPLYMAPEQFRQGQTVSPATDMYSLGMMAFTLLVGSPYWLEESRGDGNVFAFANLVMNGPTEPATLRAHRRGVTLPSAFDLWFAKATALNPADRFPTASGAVLLLADVLGVRRPGFEGVEASTTATPDVRTSAFPTPVGQDIRISDNPPSRRSGSIPGSIADVSHVPSPKRRMPVSVAIGLAAAMLGVGGAAFSLAPRGAASTTAAAPMSHNVTAAAALLEAPPAATVQAAPPINPTADALPPSSNAPTPMALASAGIADPPVKSAPVASMSPPAAASPPGGLRGTTPSRAPSKIIYQRD